MTPAESGQVASEIAELRRTVEVGFTRVDGALALLVQRGDQTDKQVDDHEKRLDSLERNRWPLPSLAAATGLIALGVTLYETAAR